MKVMVPKTWANSDMLFVYVHSCYLNEPKATKPEPDLEQISTKISRTLKVAMLMTNIHVPLCLK